MFLFFYANKKEITLLEPMKEAAGVAMSVWQLQEPGWFGFWER